MVYDKRTRKLYGTTSISDVNFPNGFVEINIDSGEGTPIGSGAGQNVNCPAVDSLGNMYAWTEDSDDLVTVDLSTGEITVLSDSGVDTAQEGMAFDRNDVLYLVNGRSGCTLYTIDTETGVGTEEGSFGLSGNIAHHGTIHPETGEYWGLDATATAAPTRNILILDLDALTLYPRLIVFI